MQLSPVQTNRFVPSPLEAPVALSEDAACPAHGIAFALSFRLRFEAHADARKPHEELVSYHIEIGRRVDRMDPKFQHLGTQPDVFPLG